VDADRCKRAFDEAAALKSQARRTLASYALSKFKLVKIGTPYGASIAAALRSFYGSLAAGHPVDRRLSGRFGCDVVELCERLGREGADAAKAATSTTVAPNVEPPARDHAPVAAAPTSRPEVLVLGATGFIGRVLARKLVAAGRPVRILVRNAGRLPDELRRQGVEVTLGDLSRPEDVERALDGVADVVHLARASVKSWSDYLEQDVAVTRRLAEACLARKVRRLVYTGTIDSYYAGAAAGTITEETPLDPRIERRNYYARAKALSEAELTAMHRERGLPLVIARPGIVIGAGGEPLHWGIGMWSYGAVCKVWAEGDAPLPLVLVDDVADGLIACLDTPGIEGQSFNLTADSGLTARDYIKALNAAAGSSYQVHHVPIRTFYLNDMAKWVVKCAVGHPDRLRRPSYRDWESRTQRARFDSSKARKVLGWKPVDDPAEVLRRGVAEPAVEFLL
jgi:nucleoside-diphosphate-sugar epimerase